MSSGAAPTTTTATTPPRRPGSPVPALVTLGVTIALIAGIVVLAALHDLTPPAAGLLGVLLGGHGATVAGSVLGGRQGG